MAKQKQPVTAAIRALRDAGIIFEGHPYKYLAKGGTARFAEEMGVHEHLVIKTLIMQDDKGKPLVVLMHGDHQVSTKALARQINVRSVQACDPKVADKHSGYQVGGTSPFGLRTRMPVYCQRSIADLERIYINGGKRGYIISMKTADMLALLQPKLVDASQNSGTTE